MSLKSKNIKIIDIPTPLKMLRNTILYKILNEWPAHSHYSGEERCCEMKYCWSQMFYNWPLDEIRQQKPWISWLKSTRAEYEWSECRQVGWQRISYNNWVCWHLRCLALETMQLHTISIFVMRQQLFTMIFELRIVF